MLWIHGGVMRAGEIAACFGHSWPTTIRHLGVLEQAGLLQFDKHGRARVYRVNSARLDLLHDWLRWFQQPGPVAEQASTGQALADELWAVLRNIALAYPEAREQSDDDERVVKVKNRRFLLLQVNGEGFSLSARLVCSQEAALQLPFVEPVRYRLGKSSWVVARFAAGDDVPLELLWEWIDESYRATAPRLLLANLAPPPTVHHSLS